MLEKDDQVGEYKLIKFLGKGQYGEVWLAEKKLQISKKKFQHALKFLFSRDDEIDLEAAEAEIDTWVEASGHPNVMSVLDMLFYKGNIVIVSEYAEAGSLREWLKRNGGIAPSQKKAIEMLLGILRGIEHLHSRNVVHRDLKPDNILLQGNFPRITDFGISRIVSENSTLTNAIGSPAYMSPEAFLGSKLPQTDIWSAGVILYEMLSGTLPFIGESVYQLKDVIQQSEPGPLPQKVPPELQEIVKKSLQKQREKRFQTAQEMREELESVLYDLFGKNKKLPANSTDPQEAVSTLPIVKTSDKSNWTFVPEILHLQEFEQMETLTDEKVGIDTLPPRINFNRLRKQASDNELQLQTETLKTNLITDKSIGKAKTESNFWLGLGVAGFVGLAIGVFGIGMLTTSLIKTPGTKNNLITSNLNVPKNIPANSLQNISINSSVPAVPEESALKRVEELESRLNILEEKSGAPIGERMDVFYSALKKDSTARGVIINYGTDMEVAKREFEIRRAISSRKYDVSRVKFVRGGTAPGIKTRFFIVPAGAQEPNP